MRKPLMCAILIAGMVGVAPLVWAQPGPGQLPPGQPEGQPGPDFQPDPHPGGPPGGFEGQPGPGFGPGPHPGGPPGQPGGQPGPGFGSGPQPGGHPDLSPFGNFEDKDIREIVSTILMVRLAKELALDSAQTVVMVRHVEDLKQAMSDLGEQRRKLIDALRKDLDSGGPDETIEAKLNELMALDVKRGTIKLEAFDQISSELTITQRAKLYVFMQDFEEHMRRLIERARDRGRDRMTPWREEGSIPGPSADRPARRGPPPSQEQPVPGAGPGRGLRQGPPPGQQPGPPPPPPQ